MRRLHPEPVGDADLDQLYGSARPAMGGRPWVGICMVASLDGAIAVQGTSKALSSQHDSAVLQRLREAADVILVGAATARGEGYGPPRKDGQRIGVVTSRAQVDTAGPLFASGSGFLVMPEDGPPAPRDGDGRQVDVVRAGRGRVDVATALARLDQVVSPPAFVQVEGGPNLNGSFVEAGCVDELNLTVSPLLVGGDGARLAVGAEVRELGFDLAHVLIDERSFVFTRWMRAAGPAER